MTAHEAQRRLLHLTMNIDVRAGTFRVTEQPLYVPPKACPEALVNPGDDPAGMEFLISAFIIVNLSDT